MIVFRAITDRKHKNRKGDKFDRSGDVYGRRGQR